MAKGMMELVHGLPDKPNTAMSEEELQNLYDRDSADVESARNTKKNVMSDDRAASVANTEAGANAQRRSVEEEAEVSQQLSAIKPSKDLSAAKADIEASMKGDLPTKTVSKYNVKKGDNLSTIAARNNMKLSQLLDLNPEYKKNPNMVRAGASINLGDSSKEVSEEPTVVTKPQAKASPKSVAKKPVSKATAMPQIEDKVVPTKPSSKPWNKIPEVKSKPKETGPANWIRKNILGMSDDEFEKKAKVQPYA